MNGRDHITISLSWGFLLTVPIFVYSPLYMIAFLIGIILGSVYPDIDSSHNPYCRGSSHDSDDEGGALSFLFGIVAYPAKHLTCFLVSRGNHAKRKEYLKHRNLMHSVLGVVISLVFVLVPVGIVMSCLNIWNTYVLIALLGIVVGAFMHLMEDSCTKSGIKFFYPFSQKKLNGNIIVRTGSRKAGSIFSLLFLVPGVTYLAYDILLKNMADFSKYNFIDGMELWIKFVLMFVIGIIAWFVCYRISQAKSWTKL